MLKFTGSQNLQSHMTLPLKAWHYTVIEYVNKRSQVHVKHGMLSPIIYAH